MAGKSKRVFTAADLKAMSRGRTITVIKPGGRTEIRVSPTPPKKGRKK